MTISFDVPPDVVSRLETAAAERGQDAAGLARAIVEESLDRMEAARRETPAVTLDRVLAGLVGVIHSSQTSGEPVSQLSEDERSFADHLEAKRRQGRL